MNNRKAKLRLTCVSRLFFLTRNLKRNGSAAQEHRSKLFQSFCSITLTVQDFHRHHLTVTRQHPNSWHHIFIHGRKKEECLPWRYQQDQSLLREKQDKIFPNKSQQMSSYISKARLCDLATLFLRKIKKKKKVKGKYLNFPASINRVGGLGMGVNIAPP